MARCGNRWRRLKEHLLERERARARERDVRRAPEHIQELTRGLEARRRGGEAPWQNRMPAGAGIGIALGMPMYIMADEATGGYINRGVGVTRDYSYSWCGGQKVPWDGGEFTKWADAGCGER